MKKFTHITFNLIGILSLLTTLTSISMDPPQEPMRTDTIIYANVCIKKQTNPALIAYESAYFPAEWERKWIKRDFNITLTPQDILIPVQFERSPQTTQEDYKKIDLMEPSIPAKLLFNLSTESILKLTIHEYSVQLMCKSNPLINDKPFHKQFKMRMKNLYNNPGSGVHEPPKETLIPSKILVETITAPDDIIRNSDGSITTIFRRSYQHGENGCASEIDLAKQAAVNKTTPYGGSFFQYAMGRETGSIFVRELTCSNIKSIAITRS